MKKLLFLLSMIISVKCFPQNVGIGTATPSASATLHLDIGTSQTKGFLVSGNSTGAHYFPALGAGKRMMFYPAHAAFRAGMVTGNQWDDANAGYYSAAFGNDVTAKGTGSFATGLRTNASGNFSNALGLYSNAKGIGLTVVGMYNDSLLAADPGVATATSPLFVVGNGDLNSNSNALVVRKDGNVAIGNFSPTHKLDVGGRMRIRSGGDEFSSPGIWFNTVDDIETVAFMGILSNDNIGLWGDRGAGWQFVMNTASGNVGIGTAFPGATNKLDVWGNINLTGTLKINEHPGFVGQVLASNGSASPTWENMPVSNPVVGFFAKKNSNQNLPHNTQTTIVSYTESFDDGNAFNPNTGIFTAPSDGVYHFDSEFCFNVNPTFEMMVTCSFFINNIQSESTAVLINSNFSTTLSYAVKLTTGNTVTLRVYQNNGTAISLVAVNTFFSGFKVY